MIERRRRGIIENSTYYSDPTVEDLAEISEEVGVDKITSLLKSVVDIVISIGVIEID